MIHQTAPATRKRVGTFPIPLWRSESVRLSLRLYDYVLALQPLFTFVRYGFTRSNNIPSKPARERRADERYEASPVIISSLRREQRGELGNGASNVLDVVGLHHQP
jgi:hypothetical protein